MFATEDKDPNIQQSIMISLDSLISPPTISIPNSFEAKDKPLISLEISEFFNDLGKPNDIKAAFGIIPFETRSLTLETTDFRAICSKVILGGTSVCSTNISHVIAKNLLSLNSLEEEFNESKGIMDMSSLPIYGSILLLPNLDIIMFSICFSLNFFINFNYFIMK